jgi:deazaflavin-dependent oxidoreductase (nitroreductase family)
MVIHRGRRSGRLYQTAVNVFAAEDGYVFALTDGPDTDWVKNVLAAGGCQLRTRGHAFRLTSPRLYYDESRRGIRPMERQVLRLIGVADFLCLQTVPAGAPTTRPILSISARSRDRIPLLPPVFGADARSRSRSALKHQERGQQQAERGNH